MAPQWISKTAHGRALEEGFDPLKWFECAMTTLWKTHWRHRSIIYNLHNSKHHELEEYCYCRNSMEYVKSTETLTSSLNLHQATWRLKPWGFSTDLSQEEKFQSSSRSSWAGRDWPILTMKFSKCWMLKYWRHASCHVMCHYVLCVSVCVCVLLAQHKADVGRCEKTYMEGMPLKELKCEAMLNWLIACSIWIFETIPGPPTPASWLEQCFVASANWARPPFTWPGQSEQWQRCVPRSPLSRC